MSGREISNKLVGTTERHYMGGSLVFVLCVGIDTKTHGLFLPVLLLLLGKLAPYFRGFNSERLSDQAFMAFHLRV
jgi:hypothetical protein